MIQEGKTECRGALPKLMKGIGICAGLCAAAGAGAGLMYFLDPSRGKVRRRLVADKVASAYHKGVRLLDHKIADVEHRATGALAELKHAVAGCAEQPVPDAKLVARVRTRLGRSIAHPHAVHVEAVQGRVVLTGEVAPEEARRAVAAAGKTPGVQAVENLLELSA